MAYWNFILATSTLLHALALERAATRHHGLARIGLELEQYAKAVHDGVEWKPQRDDTPEPPHG